MGGQAITYLAGSLCLRVHLPYQELAWPQCAHPGGGWARAVLVARPNGSAWRMPLSPKKQISPVVHEPAVPNKAITCKASGDFALLTEKTAALPNQPKNAPAQ